MSRDVVIVNYTGRRGGGLLDAFEITKALTEQGIAVVAIISEQIENLEDWKRLNLEKLVTIQTYDNKINFMIRTALFKFRQKKYIKQSTSRYNIKAIYCPMESVWMNCVNKIFKEAEVFLAVHDPKPHKGEGLVEGFIHRQYTRADKYVVHTKKFQELIAKRFGKPTYYVPLGRHNYYRSCSNKKRIITYDADKINFIFFGRISKYKGLDILAAAYRQLCNDGGPYSLTIIGNGKFDSYRSMYEGLPNLKILNQWVKDEEVESIFSGKNLICICPYKEASQSGVIYVAMDYGVPVIATDTGGLSEQIENRRNGLLIKPADADELAEAMRELACNTSLREMLGRNAAEEIKSHTWENSARQLIGFMGI